jgi:L-threonylcarbamoyladenylate synthase
LAPVTDGVDSAIAALRRGELAILPTDTVYGLAADGTSEAAATALYAAKGRESIQPTALVLSSLEVLLAAVPGLPAPTVRIARALLPGAVTLVLPNPERRFSWLNAARPDAIGVRVPALTGPGREVLEAVGMLVATSANLPGGPDPRRLDEVPAELRAAVAAVVDGGALPGIPSTVIDVTGDDPQVLREGAFPASEALARARGAVLTDR